MTTTQITKEVSHAKPEPAVLNHCNSLRTIALSSRHHLPLGLSLPHLLEFLERVHHRLSGAGCQTGLGALTHTGAPHDVSDDARHGVITVAGVGVNHQHFFQVWVGAWASSVLLEKHENGLGEELQVVELGDVVGILLQTALCVMPMHVYCRVHNRLVQATKVGNIGANYVGHLQ